MSIKKKLPLAGKKRLREFPRKKTGVSQLNTDKAEREILQLVRSGVERFILKRATIDDFFLTIQAVADKEKKYSHQLTMSVFSKIVKEAMRKRK